MTKHSYIPNTVFLRLCSFSLLFRLPFWVRDFASLFCVTALYQLPKTCQVTQSATLHSSWPLNPIRGFQVCQHATVHSPLNDSQWPRDPEVTYHVIVYNIVHLRAFQCLFVWHEVTLQIPSKSLKTWCEVPSVLFCHFLLKNLFFCL